MPNVREGRKELGEGSTSLRPQGGPGRGEGQRQRPGEGTRRPGATPPPSHPRPPPSHSPEVASTAHARLPAPPSPALSGQGAGWLAPWRAVAFCPKGWAVSGPAGSLVLPHA